MGCDQQGRYPQAAECCTEIGQEPNESEHRTWIPLIVYLTLLASIVTVLLAGV